MEIKAPSIIDWKLLAYELDLKEDDPESMVHELVHAYDCIGEKAFEHVGRQSEVRNLICDKYKSEENSDKAEIRVSVITFLVIQPFGFADLTIMLSDMKCNLTKDWCVKYSDEKTDLMFLKFLRTRSIQNTAKKIQMFIETNFQLGDFCG